MCELDFIWKRLESCLHLLWWRLDCNVNINMTYTKIGYLPFRHNRPMECNVQWSRYKYLVENGRKDSITSQLQIRTTRLVVITVIMWNKDEQRENPVFAMSLYYTTLLFCNYTLVNAEVEGDPLGFWGELAACLHTHTFFKQTVNSPWSCRSVIVLLHYLLAVVLYFQRNAWVDLTPGA